jgi:hypothetical protein
MEVMDLEANPEEKESKILKEHAAVKHVGGLRKEHRGWNLAAECHQKSKEWTWLAKLWIPEEIGHCWEKLDQGHGT